MLSYPFKIKNTIDTLYQIHYNKINRKNQYLCIIVKEVAFVLADEEIKSIRKRLEALERHHE